jgi:drug/metabolite transporter (DMT)-like permease
LGVVVQAEGATVPTVLLACATALFYGCSDFFGGLASRRDSALRVTASAHLLGAVLLGGAALFLAAHATASDLLWGVATGVAGGIGVTALYAALARGRMSVVAPITAALSGTLPALFDLARGTAVSQLSLVGLGVAIIAVVIVSAADGGAESGGMPPVALGLSLVAGLGFAASFVMLSFTSAAAGIMPVLSARVTSAVVLTAAALWRHRTLGVASGALPSTAAAGALDAAATVAMLAAIHAGPLAVAAVIGSLYPVATILLARFVLGERLRPVQRAGVALALIAVLLTALH